MKRGDLVPVAARGGYGSKPRPALVIQSDDFTTQSVTVMLIHGEQTQGAPLMRIPLTPTPENGLRKPSEVMIDKTMTFMRSQMGEPFGAVSKAEMQEVKRALAIFLGFAD